MGIFFGQTGILYPKSPILIKDEGDIMDRLGGIIDR